MHLQVLAIFVLVGAATSRAREPVRAAPDNVRAAVNKALPLLLKGAKGHIAKKSCFACHNQATPLMALITAGKHGFKISEEDITEQTKFIARFLDGNRQRYREGKGQGGQIDTAGYALLSLELGGWQPDATTAAVAEYMLLYDKELDHWRSLSKRPPSEASDFTFTYLAIRGLVQWGTLEQEDRIAKRIAAARSWLRSRPPVDTEDRVFRLLGMHAAGVADKELQGAVYDLVRTQRQDGGWGQRDNMACDAYATGAALMALHLAGGLQTSSLTYQRGVTFLLNSQLEDGSWRIKSRSKPFQTYYESGFPHGKDQFISMAASGWATAALALACPPAAKPADNRHER